MTRRILSAVLGLAAAGLAPAAIFSENFSGFSDGNVHAQGGWTSALGMTIRSDGTLPGTILSGLLTGDSQALHLASHSVSLVGETGEIVLSFDAFGLAAPTSDGIHSSHNSGAGLGFDGSGIAAGWTARNGIWWRFDATALGGGVVDIAGGFQDFGPDRLEVVINRSTGKVFGRYSFFNGPSGTTTAWDLTVDVDLLTQIVAQQDLTDTQFFTGVELDNFNLVSSPQAVPEPFTAGLAASGVALGLRRLRKRRLN